MPVSAVFLAAGTLALSGLPPFSVFLSESAAVSGITAGHMYLVAALASCLWSLWVRWVHLVAVTLSGQAPESIAKGEQGSMTLIPAAAAGPAACYGHLHARPCGEHAQRSHQHSAG